MYLIYGNLWLFIKVDSWLVESSSLASNQKLVVTTLWKTPSDAKYKPEVMYALRRDLPSSSSPCCYIMLRCAVEAYLWKPFDWKYWRCQWRWKIIVRESYWWHVRHTCSDFAGLGVTFPLGHLVMTYMTFLTTLGYFCQQAGKCHRISVDQNHCLRLICMQEIKCTTTKLWCAKD